MAATRGFAALTAAAAVMRKSRLVWIIPAFRLLSCDTLAD
jgi:hypothetical protein